MKTIIVNNKKNNKNNNSNNKKVDSKRSSKNTEKNIGKSAPKTHLSGFCSKIFYTEISHHVATNQMDCCKIQVLVSTQCKRLKQGIS